MKYKLKREKRQGCPLSPLLFILTLEPLLYEILRKSEGPKLKKQEYKVQAFADDLVFILEDPLTSIENLIQEIKEYEIVVGLKINTHKTKMIVKNMQYQQKEDLMLKSKLTIENKIKYLGIWITSRCSSIFEDNYMELLKNITGPLILPS